MKRIARCAAVLFLLLAWAGHALAEEPLLTQVKVFSMPSYTTVGGRTLKNLRIGYETYGKLNAAGTNAILVDHFFSGTSHAAGRYKADDKVPGYWDAIIGPGKAIDTDRWFVVAADTLANLNTRDPNVVTTGPASIDPDTGKPYGMRFPVVTARDFVRVQKALVDSLGVKKLHAVAGASGGAIQSLEWAAAYPEMVERAIPVIGPGLEIHPYLIAVMDGWYAAIQVDPKWNGGDYYGKEEPVAGLSAALRVLTIETLAPGWAERVHGYKYADAGKAPAGAVANLFSIQAGIDAAALARARLYDANSVIYSAKAYQQYDLGKDAARIKAKVLFVPAKSDLLFPPELSRRAAERLRAQGTYADVYEIEGDGGHLDGILAIGRAADRIRAFVEN